MKNNILVFIIISLILVSVTGSSIALDPVTEDSWIGSYFLKQDLLNDKEKINPFLDIRQSNINQSNLSSNFKLILANSILANNLQTYKLMKERNIDLDEIYKLENLIINYNDNPEQIKIELAIMDKLKDEIINSYELNLKNKNKYLIYKFYHIFLYRTETFTTPDMKRDFKNKSFQEDFKINNNELKESKVNTKYFNDLTPLSPQEVLKFSDSPLVTINSYNISKKDKEKVLNELPNAEFLYRYRVSIRQFPFKYQDIENLYLELLKMNNDDSDLIKSVRNSHYYNMNIRQLFRRLEEVV